MVGSSSGRLAGTQQLILKVTKLDEEEKTVSAKDGFDTVYEFRYTDDSTLRKLTPTESETPLKEAIKETPDVLVEGRSILVDWKPVESRRVLVRLTIN